MIKLLLPLVLVALYSCTPSDSKDRERLTLSFLEEIKFLQDSLRCYAVAPGILGYQHDESRYITDYTCDIIMTDSCRGKGYRPVKPTKSDLKIPYQIANLDSLKGLGIEHLHLTKKLIFKQKGFKGFGANKCTIGAPIYVFNPSDSLSMGFSQVHFERKVLDDIISFDKHKASFFALKIANCSFSSDTIFLEGMMNLYALTFYSQQKKYLKIENCPNLKVIFIGSDDGYIELISKLGDDVQIL